MPQHLIDVLNPARIKAYEEEWARDAELPDAHVSGTAVAALYTWQVSLSAAWYETLAYTEAVVRNAVDMALREWNTGQGRTEDWLGDAARPLGGLVEKAAEETSRRAEQASRKRDKLHPRYRQAASFDDRVAQLDFGHLVHLLPLSPPTNRASRESGRNARENIWFHGLRAAFPGLKAQTMSSWSGVPAHRLPEELRGGYAVGIALDRLRRLRNRVSHHEQTFRVEHEQRLRDVSMLLTAISPETNRIVSSLEGVRRVLTMRPRP